MSTKKRTSNRWNIIRVPLRPVAKGRPRINRKTGRVFTPKSVVAFTQHLREHVKQQGVALLDRGPLEVRLRFLLRRPRQITTTANRNGATHRARKPDINNLIASVFDALNGVAYRDDSQIAKVAAVKVDAPSDLTEILIRPLGDSP